MLPARAWRLQATRRAVRTGRIAVVVENRRGEAISKQADKRSGMKKADFPERKTVLSRPRFYKRDNEIIRFSEKM
jgi:hypothetical protein